MSTTRSMTRVVFPVPAPASTSTFRARDVPAARDPGSDEGVERDLQVPRRAEIGARLQPAGLHVTHDEPRRRAVDAVDEAVHVEHALAVEAERDGLGVAEGRFHLREL